MKKKIVVLGAIVIMIAILAAGSLGYFVVEGIATNIITIGTVKVDLTEKELSQGILIGYVDEKEVVPGRTVSKVPIVENTGTEPFYTRVHVQIKATAADEKTPLPVDCVKLWLEKEEWKQNVWEPDQKWMWLTEQEDWLIVEVDDGDDNVYTAWYYYTGAVEPGQKVAPFNEVEFTGAMNNDYISATITVALTAQAVQSEHNEIPEGGDILDVVGWPEAPSGTD